MSRQIKNRTVDKARILYLYVIFGGIAMFGYAISCIFTGWPLWYAPLPIVFLLFWFLGVMTVKNAKSFWMYISDINQGRLHLALTDMTHFGVKNKARLVEWVYPKRNQIRNETWLRLGEKVRTGQALTNEEKKMAKKKVVVCPQQLLDGVNKAILAHALIYAHKNICVLDDELREILELTDENMNNFSIETEIDRCRKAEYKKKYDRFREEAIKNLEQDKA